MPATDFIVIHYAEIGLKSGNRKYFETLLMSNISRKLGVDTAALRRETGQITLRLDGAADAAACIDVLRRIPGIAYLTPATCVDSDIASLEQAGVAVLADREFATFKVETRRRNKAVAYRSMDVNRAVGAAVLSAHPEAKARMDAPEVVLRVEVTGPRAYVSTANVPGVGGLPTNRRQKVVALLSGGLDSPVAAYLLMKRGCEVVLVHFQNSNQMTASVEDKIVQLAAQLARYQVRTRLHLVPFAGLQEAIIRTVPGHLRMLVYRRVMLRLAGRVAARCRARFLAVGDSFSQVASQTYENLDATYAVAERPILTPVIGLDKREITDISREIETFDISALPYGDCCSYFLPKHPELRGRDDVLSEAEEDLDLESLGREALEGARLMEWD